MPFPIYNEIFAYGKKRVWKNMHGMHETLPPGAIVGDRYLVIDLIGTGGFSAVYLVQDRQREDSFFALKEVIATHQEATERFVFECALLERLVHPSLPRVYHVFDDDEHSRLYMLMDYVEGPNLEMLRQVQHEKRFSFPVIIAILAPVVDAIGYLHQQDPPIIHRDIKPSNIIVPVAGGEAILVDFGIAKMYDTHRTTSAVRYGSPGYGAPEHYTTGTNARSDIYGLGATLYTLLTGEIPPEAVDRMTQISNEDIDPLKPINELVPTIPLHISGAIHRAMSIKMSQRFATVREFWQALQGESVQQPTLSQALSSIGVSSAPSPQTPQERPHRHQRKRILLSALLVLVMIVGIGAGLWRFTGIGKNHPTTPPAVGSVGILPPPTLSPSIRPSSIATSSSRPNAYPRLATSYNGTIVDLETDVPSQMTLTKMQQGGGHISGSFNAMLMSAPYAGFLDTSKHIYFTVMTDGGRTQLNFTGSIRADGSLAGSFCQVDQNGQCTSGLFGLWNVAPVTPVKLAVTLLRRNQADDVM